jgi:hypothetical protein
VFSWELSPSAQYDAGLSMEESASMPGSVAGHLGLVVIVVSVIKTSSGSLVAVWHVDTVVVVAG